MVTDDPRTDDASTVVTLGMLEQILPSILSQVLDEALGPIIERLDRIESDVATLKADVATLKSDMNGLQAEMLSVQGSLNTIRREGLDMRAAVDGMKAELRHLRNPVPAE